MTYPKDESGKWTQDTSQAAGELIQNRDKILDAAAARGFAALPGDAVMDVFDLEQTVKGKLTQALGKIYHERRATLFQQQEFILKVLVQASKLGMDLYREELLGALALEAAEEDAWGTRSRADIERTNAITEARQTALIQAKAEIEYDIANYKQQLVDAEAVTMESERALVYSQLATAEKKLEIVQSIYQVLAAEQLVIAAEWRKLNSLQLVLAAEQITAGVEREMIPFYIQKADAKVQLAQAITADIPIQKAIVELGYDKIDLENAEKAADHVVRQAQQDEALAQADYTKAALALELVKTQGRRMLQELATDVKMYVQDHKKILDEQGIDLRLFSSLQRETVAVNNDARVTQQEINNMTGELVNILRNLGLRGVDHAATVRDGADLVQLAASTSHNSYEQSSRTIKKG
jgi:hypothetical protein